jgi:predicted DCC family thiol-disulfide oxidoreductase YuxK
MSLTQQSLSQKTTSWQIKLLYDGQCPLCVREVNFLKKRDHGRGLVIFVDIADDHYLPQEHGGVDFATAMGRIHAVLPDGTIIQNVAVFRHVYEILGLGWVYGITRLPLIEAIANFVYGVWANLRLKLTGRPDLSIMIAERQQRLSCQDLERCRLSSETTNNFI